MRTGTTPDPTNPAHLFAGRFKTRCPMGSTKTTTREWIASHYEPMCPDFEDIDPADPDYDRPVLRAGRLTAHNITVDVLDLDDGIWIAVGVADYDHEICQGDAVLLTGKNGVRAGIRETCELYGLRVAGFTLIDVALPGGAA